MTNARELDNQKFGRLVVVRRHPENSKHGNAQWECLCECGNTKIVVTGSLMKGVTRSCGCLQKETIKEIATIHGNYLLPEYDVWNGIRHRCYNKKHRGYPRYGGRGIGMCDEWKESFEAFYRDMGSRPSPEHSIDRRNNDMGYSKDNCHWATKLEQANNRSSNITYEYRGEVKSLKDWCRYLNLDYNIVRYRIGKYAWTFEEAIYPIEFMEITFDGVKQTLEQWCDLLGLKPHQTYLRVLRGEPFDKIALE